MRISSFLVLSFCIFHSNSTNKYRRFTRRKLTKINTYLNDEKGISNINVSTHHLRLRYNLQEQIMVLFNMLHILLFPKITEWIFNRR